MTGAAGSDTELLGQFVHAGDGASFQEIISRHGSTVHGVCRGILDDIHEAEDAFQATFLVLARRASEIRDPESLGGWLRGVAYRVATRAGRRAVRRRQIERTWAGIPRAEPAGSSSGVDCDLREFVGRELMRLPEDYRRPLVLCYLDGLTHQEAARRLNWPVGTVKVRLVRGRRALRDRLNRRGVALGEASWCSCRTAAGPAPRREPLKEATVEAMILAATGRFDRLGREFPGACELAGSMALVGLARGARICAAVIVAAAVVLGLAAPLSWALSGPPRPDVDPSTLPSNLADVLNVECR